MPYKDIEKKKEYQRKLMAERRAKIKELKNVSPVSPNEKALDPNLNVIPENQKKDVIPVISEAIADFGLKSSSNVIPDLNVIPIKPASPVCETETREHRRVLVSVENSKPKLIADTTNLVVAEPLVLESVAKVSVNLKKEVDENAEALSKVEPKIVNQVELELAPNVESVNANKNKNKAEREEQSKSEVIKISRVVPDEFLSKTDTSRKMVEGKEYVYINGR
ncbi:1597_t:CDS:1 [Racocetra persica]|uniref:1597_t:CDS:1 n=1 Tax=Racocetra persica TaxID=160502 RepID=A0ACA9L241_9GLOM|nr:1597_t:CDS:1 [Racocetra persica]